MSVRTLEKREYLTLAQSQSDVEAIRDEIAPSIGREAADSYDFFLVDVRKGDYDEIWGIHGTPDLDKTAVKIK